MKLLNLIEEFSHYKNNREIEKCFQCLSEYKVRAAKLKNYSQFENFNINEIKSKNIIGIWNQIKFEKSLLEYNFNDLNASFNDIYREYFSGQYKINLDFWEYISDLLKGHNSKIYEINILKLELEIILEVLTSYRFNLAIPTNRKIQKIIELILIGSSENQVFRTLNKYFHLIGDKKLENNYYDAFPKAREKIHQDNFLNVLKGHKIKRDVRIDVLINNFESPLQGVLEEKTNIEEFVRNESIFSYLVPSRVFSTINIVEYYLSEGQYKIAEFELEKIYEQQEKNFNYYYFYIYIQYRINGAMFALRKLVSLDIDTLVVSNKEFLELIIRLKAEALIGGNPR